MHVGSVVQLCPTLWDPVGCGPQTPLSVGFPRQEHWSGLPFPTLGDLPGPGITSAPLVSPALADGFFTTVPTGDARRAWVQWSRSAVSASLWPHRLQRTRLPCPSLISRACSDSCPLSRWCHPTVASSVVPFSSCLQRFQHQKEV